MPIVDESNLILPLTRKTVEECVKKSLDAQRLKLLQFSLKDYNEETNDIYTENMKDIIRRTSEIDLSFQNIGYIDSLYLLK
ncbi:MAG: hypothetical protein MHPSP_002489, partial [Paramarteilia canceri]